MNQSKQSLADILNSSHIGTQLCEVHRRKNFILEEVQRVQLINLIARYFIDNNIKLTMSISRSLVKEVVERFQGEEEVSIINIIIK